VLGTISSFWAIGTHVFTCFALSIKTKPIPYVLKHYKGVIEARATSKELAYILVLVMREQQEPTIA